MLDLGEECKRPRASLLTAGIIVHRFFRISVCLCLPLLSLPRWRPFPRCRSCLQSYPSRCLDPSPLPYSLEVGRLSIFLGVIPHVSPHSTSPAALPLCIHPAGNTQLLVGTGIGENSPLPPFFHLFLVPIGGKYFVSDSGKDVLLVILR